MYPQFPKFPKLALLSAALILTVSCSKDTDLLADYVVSNSIKTQFLGNLVADDHYFMANTESIVLDILSNDIFEKPDKVKIVEISEPSNGTVTINEDKTITYKPLEEKNNKSVDTTSENTQLEVSTIKEIDSTTVLSPIESDNDNEDEKPSSDNFTYTVETTDENGDTETQEGTVNISFDYGELRAFPGAEGYGKYTTGGRGGKVLHVTNLNDKGPGSLRDAIEVKSGSRTIVFDVSGYISLKTSLKIKGGQGNVTIAGQTAPNGGITLRGASVWIMDSNVIMRYIRIRPGKAWQPNNSKPSDLNYEPDDAFRIIAFNGSHIRNVILDHCTISWGRDGIIDITTVGTNSSIKDITVQNTILSENVDKGYASLISGNIDNLTFYKNYIAHCNTRNVAMNALNGDIEFVNNVIYGLGRGAWIKYSCRANLIGNVYFTNPNNPRSSQTLRLEKNNKKPELTKIFLKDNSDDGAEITYNSRIGKHLYNSPNQESGLKYISNSSVKSSVISKVGSSIYRDAVDKRVINQLNTKSGKFIKHENEVGGYPTIGSKTNGNTFDSDRDGMSDKWEADNNFSSPYEMDSNKDHNDDGYTDLEDYLHHLTQVANSNS